MYIYQLDKLSSAQNSEPGPGPHTPSPGVRNRQHGQGGLKTCPLIVDCIMSPGSCICLVSPAVTGHYHWTRMSWSVAGWSWMAGSRVSVSRVQNQIVVIYGGAGPAQPSLVILPALSLFPRDTRHAATIPSVQTGVGFSPPRSVNLPFFHLGLLKGRFSSL